MRYLHYEAGKISRYICENHLHLLKCSYDGVAAPIEAEPGIIAEMFNASETLWGLRLPYYVIASKTPEAEMMSLQEAVSNAETAKIPDAFVVAAYQDGGLITVSGVVLPFQIDALPADWWWPTIRSAWAARFGNWRTRLKWLT
jgi:hypothetical protein